MKLARFLGKGIRGNKNIEIEFYNEVNFLTGVNGCGKTTVLRLLKGLLTPSLSDLVDIKYDFVSIELIDCNSNLCYITSEKTDDDVFIGFKYRDDVIDKDKISISKFRRAQERPSSLEQLIQRIRTFQTIKKYCAPPLILGTDRLLVRRFLYDEDEYRFRFGRIIHNFGYRNNYTIFLALQEIIDRLQYLVRMNSSQQEKLANEFKKSVLSVSLKLIPVKNSNHDDYEKELKQLKNKREKFISSYKDLMEKEFSEDINKIFDDAEAWLNTLITASKDSDEYKDAMMSWKSNANQMSRVDDIINLSENYSANIDKLKSPINRFVESANLFFKETKKQVVVSDDGEIKIIGYDVENNIFELSSGEQQLIIMLGHLAFSNPEIFIVDEPEISLHLAWQDEFVNALQMANPATQYVMATHAPAIVHGREDCCIDLTSI